MTDVACIKGFVFCIHMVSKTDVACIKGFKSTLKNKIILNYPKFAAKGIFS